MKKKDAEEIRDYHSEIISDNLRYINYGILIAFFRVYIYMDILVQQPFYFG